MAVDSHAPVKICQSLFCYGRPFWTRQRAPELCYQARDLAGIVAGVLGDHLEARRIPEFKFLLEVGEGKAGLPALSILIREFDIGDIFIELSKDPLFEYLLVFVGLNYRHVFIIIHSEQK